MNMKAVEIVKCLLGYKIEKYSELDIINRIEI